MPESWVGVNFDGTLAYEGRWRGPNHAGEPIRLMVRRVKDWLSRGQKVKIFTARADENNPEYAENIKTIQEWCFLNLGEILEITNKKDKYMIELWDNKAIQIISNTGIRIDGKV